MTTPTRPACFEFAMSFLGDPEETELRSYIEALEARAALAQPEPVGPTDKEIIGCMYKGAASLSRLEPTWIARNTAECVAGVRAAITLDRARWGRPAIEPVPDTKARELLKLLLDDLDALIDDSEGVTGLHLNGEVASWESLREGGTFETWLMRMDEARAFLDSTMDKPADARPAIEPEPEGRPWPVPGDAEGLAEVFWGNYDQFEPEGTTRNRAEQRTAQPEPEGQVGPTVAELRNLWGACNSPSVFARAVLARWGRPAITPIPVSERRGEEDCDAEGRC